MIKQLQNKLINKFSNITITTQIKNNDYVLFLHFYKSGLKMCYKVSADKLETDFNVVYMEIVYIISNEIQKSIENK